MTYYYQNLNVSLANSNLPQAGCTKNKVEVDNIVSKEWMIFLSSQLKYSIIDILFISVLRPRASELVSTHAPTQ